VKARLFAAAIACALVTTAVAAPKPKKPKEKPGAYPPTIELPSDYQNISREALDSAIRASLKSAVQFFADRAEKDPGERWVVPPRRQRKIVDRKTVTIRYREETKVIDAPIYKYEYETYEITVPVKQGSETGAAVTYRKEQRRRVKSRTQTGTEKKKITHHVRDDAGSIERKHVKPVYGPGGPDVWGHDVLGQNAMVLYALRVAGVGPQETPAVQLAENLSEFVKHYGMPDTTWDLAWLTAAFSTMPTNRYAATTEKLASKLMDGQILDGTARGLWGPSCINTPLLADMATRLQRLGAAIPEAKKRAQSGSIEATRMLDKAEGEYRDTLREIKRVALGAMAGNKIEVHVNVESRMGEKALVQGLIDYIYNQRSADIESTALALFALRKASDRKILPQKLWRPSTPIRAELRQNATARVVLSRAIHALVGTQRQDSGWSQLNWHQPVTEFARLTTFPGLPPAKVQFPRLKSDQNLLSNAQGFTALLNAGHAIGFSDLIRRYGDKVDAGLAYYRQLSEQLLNEHPPAEEIGGHLAPYECAFFMLDAARNAGGLEEDRRDLWARLSCLVLSMRHPDGSWKIKLPVYETHRRPTSLDARTQVLSPPKKGVLTDLSAPHVARWGWSLKAQRDAYLKTNKRAQQVTLDVVPTALSMIILADSLRPPVAGDCAWSGPESHSKIASVITSVMQSRQDTSLRYAKVSRPLDLRKIAELPGLILQGTGAFDPSHVEKDALRSYLDGGGLVAVVAKGDAGGREFLDSARSTLQSLLEGSTEADIGDDTDLLGTVAGESAFKGLKRADGSLSAIFMPLAIKGSAGGASPPVAAKAAYNLLMQKENPEALSPRYPIAYEPEKTPESLILEALSGILEPEPEATPTEDATEAEPAPAADTSLKDDETL